MWRWPCKSSRRRRRFPYQHYGVNGDKMTGEGTTELLCAQMLSQTTHEARGAPDSEWEMNQVDQIR